MLTVVTGVAGSGKSSLIRDVFAKQYADRVVLVDQSAVTATGRSTACTYLGFFDEIRKVFAAETGLHASDIRQIMELLDSLIRRGNTVIVIEHNTDVMKLADYIIDIGPDGGTSGGEVVFTGTPQEMMEHADTITARYLRK